MAKLRVLKRDALVRQVLAEQKRQIATATVKSIIELTCQKLADALVKGQSFRLPSIGRISPRDLAARTGRNPRTGASLAIEARKGLRVVMNEAFKQRINKPIKPTKTKAKVSGKKRK